MSAELLKCHKPHQSHVQANVKGADEPEAILDVSMSHPHSVAKKMPVTVKVFFPHHQQSCSSQFRLKRHKPMKYYYIGYKYSVDGGNDRSGCCAGPSLTGYRWQQNIKPVVMLQNNRGLLFFFFFTKLTRRYDRVAQTSDKDSNRNDPSGKQWMVLS